MVSGMATVDAGGKGRGGELRWCDGVGLLSWRSDGLQQMQRVYPWYPVVIF